MKTSGSTRRKRYEPPSRPTGARKAEKLATLGWDVVDPLRLGFTRCARRPDNHQWRKGHSGANGVERGQILGKVAFFRFFFTTSLLSGRAISQSPQDPPPVRIGVTVLFPSWCVPIKCAEADIAR